MCKSRSPSATGCHLVGTGALSDLVPAEHSAHSLAGISSIHVVLYTGLWSTHNLEAYGSNQILHGGVSVAALSDILTLEVL